MSDVCQSPNFLLQPSCFIHQNFSKSDSKSPKFHACFLECDKNLKSSFIPRESTPH